MSTTMLSREQLVLMLKEQIASLTKQNIELIDENINFLKFGITSIETIMIMNKLEKQLGIDVNPIAMFECKNINALSTYLSENLG